MSKPDPIKDDMINTLHDMQAAHVNAAMFLGNKIDEWTREAGPDDDDDVILDDDDEEVIDEDLEDDNVND